MKSSLLSQLYLVYRCLAVMTMVRSCSACISVEYEQINMHLSYYAFTLTKNKRKYTFLNENCVLMFLGARLKTSFSSKFEIQQRGGGADSLLVRISDSKKFCIANIGLYPKIYKLVFSFVGLKLLAISSNIAVKTFSFNH